MAPLAIAEYYVLPTRGAAFVIRSDRLTRPEPGTTIGTVMRRFLRQHTKPVGSVLLSVFILVLSVTCLAQQQMTEAQMACCASIAADCGASMGQEHTCCPTESPRLDQQPAAAGPRLVAPAPELIAFLMFGLDAAISPGVFSNEPEVSPPLAARPAYLTLSVLRV